MLNSRTMNGGQVSNPFRRRRWLLIQGMFVFISSRKGGQPTENSFALTQIKFDIASDCVDPVDIGSDDSVASSFRRSLSLSQNSSIRAHFSIDIPPDTDNREIVEEFANSQAEEDSVDHPSIPRVRNGTNPIHRKGFCCHLLQSRIVTIILLVSTSGLFFAIGIMDQGAKDGWHDGVVILVCTCLVVIVPSVKNFLRARKVMKKRNKFDVEVERNGQVIKVAHSEVSVGDIVLLKTGDYVPVNGMLIEGNLLLDEVLRPCTDLDQNSNLFAGFKVNEGQGRMMVKSAFGENGNSHQFDSSNEKLFHVLIDEQYVAIDNISFFVCALIAVQALIRLLWKKQHPDNSELPEMKGEVPLKYVMKVVEKILLKPQGRVSSLASTMVALVIGIQHGLPLVISLSLHQWNKKLASAEIDPQNLAACATMGLVDVIIIDATGRLLCDQKMEVKKFWLGEKDVSIDASGCGAEQVVLDRLHQGIVVSVHVPGVSICPTNDVLITWMNTRWSMNIESSNKKFDILKYKSLSYSKKGHGVLVRKIDDEQSNLHLHWRGAAPVILNMCTHFYDDKGKIRPLEEKIGEIETRVKDMENNGLTPIALACGQTDIEELKEDGLILLAIVGLKYTCSEEMKSVVDEFKKSGIAIKLVSEDKLPTLRGFASELELPDEIEAAEGQEIQDAVSNIDRIGIIGNCNSKTKFCVVHISKKKGQVVAFFGGLTSIDAPPLKGADLGITQIGCSTHMARNVSDISIPSVSSLKLILKCGKCAYQNIQRFFQLQLTAFLSHLIVNIVVEMFTGDSPLTSLHLIWVNLIISLLGGLMMVMELNDKEQQLSNRRTLVTKAMWKSIAIQVTYQVSVLLIFEFIGNHAFPHMNKDVSNTIVFNTYTLCQLFNLFNVMGLMEKKVLLVVFQSSWFLGALGAVLVMQVTMVELGIRMLGCVRLSWMHWIFCFFIAALSWGSEPATKWLQALILSLSPALAQSTTMLISSDRSHRFFSIFPVGFLFSLVFVFSVSYYFQPQVARTFR